jgi:hypothetical protein
MLKKREKKKPKKKREKKNTQEISLLIEELPVPTTLSQAE